MSNYCFDKEGLFLAFISYPFQVDGKKIFNEVISKFFEQHKARLYQYDLSSDGSADLLYKPVAYRMLGSQGLLVISLLDDYSFCSRHFNKNHIRTLLEDAYPNEKINNDLLKYKSVVITGVHECKEEERDTQTLEKKAENTFLREGQQYPYVGVIRMKIDHQLLQGKGIDAIRAIKNKLEAVRQQQKDDCLDYIPVDCFDNDEMTVVAFSDSLSSLASFLGNIRDLKNDGDKILEFKQSGKLRDKHLFSSTYISLGYNVNFAMDNKDSNQDFLSPNQDDEKSIKINCLIETRPGHRDSFEDYLIKNLSQKASERILSGGSAIRIEISLNDISVLIKMFEAQEADRDVRKIKMSLQYDGYELIPDPLKEHAENFKAQVIPEGVKKEIKRQLKKIGVSKIVRDRLFALFELYDSSRRDMIQTMYFDELSGMGKIFLNTIQGLCISEDIKNIEDVLDREITNLENACYDRVHNRKYAENLLEYSGGVQQHLISFGYAYSVISSALSGREVGKDIYTIITGAERVSSERTHLNLNINHILFPELFVTTAWKEASNMNIKVLSRYGYRDVLTAYSKEGDDNNVYIQEIWRFFSLLNTWHDFISNKASITYLKYLTLQELNMLLKQDEVLIDFKSILKQDLLKYFIKDYVVFHFAFLRDFEKLWHFNFKAFLQTTNCYNKLGKIKRVQLIYNLLRLFMVGIRADRASGSTSCVDFIMRQKYNPFDVVLKEYWMDCFDKTWTIARKMADILNEYGFMQISEYQIAICEQNTLNMPLVGQSNKYNVKKLFGNEILGLDVIIRKNLLQIKKRKKIVDSFENYWHLGSIINCDDYNSADYIICLLNSFVSEIYKIDSDNTKTNHPIKSLPRDDEGEIMEIFHVSDLNNEPLFNKMIPILSDTTGGFFLPFFKTRESYFVLRTVLYRSMWNFKMKMSNSLQ